MTEISRAAQVANLAHEVVSVKDFGAVGDGVTDDTSAIQSFIDHVTSNHINGYINAGKYKISSTLNFTGSRYSISGPQSINGRWDLKEGVVEFIYTGDSANDLMVIGGNAGAAAENIYIGNFVIYPETNYGCNRGIVLDGSNSIVSTRQYLRGSVFENIAVHRCNGAGIELLGNVFDVKFYNPTSRKHNGACYKTTTASVVTGLAVADQIDIYSPMFYSLGQGSSVTNYNAWAFDARGTVVYGGNFQGSLGAKVGFASSIDRTHIEDDQGLSQNTQGSIGVMDAGKTNEYNPVFIAGYQRGIVIGDIDNPSADVSGTFARTSLIDCKNITGSKGVDILASGGRRSKIEIGQIYQAVTEVDDSRGLNDVRLYVNGAEYSSWRNVSGATPNVSNRDLFTLTQGGATVVTDFIGGRDGQQIKMLVRNADTTFDFTGTNLKGNDGVDYAASINDLITATYYSSLGVWLCQITKG